MRRPKTLIHCLVYIGLATAIWPLFGVAMLALLLYITRSARMDGKRRLHYDQAEVRRLRDAVAVANRPVAPPVEVVRDAAA